MVFVNDRGDVAWQPPLSKLDTGEERSPLKYHPYNASLQRSVAGWAWYNSNVGRLLPDYRNIEVEPGANPLPYLGSAAF